jgi:hypothetical protein
MPREPNYLTCGGSSSADAPAEGLRVAVNPELVIIAHMLLQKLALGEADSTGAAGDLASCRCRLSSSSSSDCSCRAGLGSSA